MKKLLVSIIILSFLTGCAQIKELGIGEIVIDEVVVLTKAEIPKTDWTIVSDKDVREIDFTENKIALLPISKTITGTELEKTLDINQVLDANALDYLLKNPDLIPVEWKDKGVFFWGTVYEDKEKNQYVRYLYWSGDYDENGIEIGGRWASHYFDLNHNFRVDNPTAILIIK